VYVCDNSSTIYEFAATGRPVVVLNGPHYRRDVHHGLRFWDAADVGIQVDHPRDLPDAIEEALRDPEPRRRAREAALGIVYAHRTGAAQRAAAALTDWMAA
jgi:UDP-N-acetylglucosamine:LPS N-acetylglucosamine transferase